MPRAWIWLQLILGWLPMGALFALLILSAHGGTIAEAAVSALPMMLTAAALGLVVHRFTLRVPWPYPLRLRFFGVHLIAAVVFAAVWFVSTVAINSAIASVLMSMRKGSYVFALAVGPGIVPYLILGVWLYIMVAGIVYANRAAERAARIEAQAARAQLAALRAQLHPHLLFNALHTVVQLIPIDPARATRAAEELAGILRVALSERRDVIAFAEEWAFVQRYLAIESLRFGDRLDVRATIAASAQSALIPAFGLQTLVENAVRHAAAPREQATEVRVSARCDDGVLRVTVADDGPGAAAQQIEGGAGTGLRRLRERLAWLCGDAAQLDITSAPGTGFRVELTLPQAALRAAATRDPGHDE